MRIDAYNQITQIYKSSSKLKTQKSSGSTLKDKVEISDFGKVYNTSKMAVKNAPDIREDRVYDIKKRIDSGNYDVSAESFADKILEKYSGL